MNENPQQKVMYYTVFYNAHLDGNEEYEHLLRTEGRGDHVHFPDLWVDKTVLNRETEFAKSKFFNLMTFTYFPPYWKGLNDIYECFKDMNGDEQQNALNTLPKVSRNWYLGDNTVWTTGRCWPKAIFKVGMI